jgi:hypothetical protein
MKLLLIPILELYVYLITGATSFLAFDSPHAFEFSAVLKRFFILVILRTHTSVAP